MASSCFCATTKVFRAFPQENVSDALRSSYPSFPDTLTRTSNFLPPSPLAGLTLHHAAQAAGTLTAQFLDELNSTTKDAASEDTSARPEEYCPANSRDSAATGGSGGLGVGDGDGESPLPHEANAKSAKTAHTATMDKKHFDFIAVAC